jgi:hypothetical protein
MTTILSADERAQIDELMARLKELRRGCGTCQACCTIMRVDMTPLDAPPKPERQRCGHLCSAGCRIYDAKPDSCTSFMCLWLAMELFENRLPAAWRPDHIGAVVDVNPIGVMTVHLKHEERWRREGPLRDMLIYLAGNEPNRHGFVVLDRPSGNHLLFRANGSTEDLIPCGVNAAGFKEFRTKYPWED